MPSTTHLKEQKQSQMHKWQGSKCLSKMFHEYISYIMILKVAAWRRLYTLNNTVEMPRHPTIQLSPRSYEDFHTKSRHGATTLDR